MLFLSLKVKLKYVIPVILISYYRYMTRKYNNIYININVVKLKNIYIIN